jgi:hypothetical protein
MPIPPRSHDPNTIDLRAEIDALIAQLPMAGLMRLWRLLLAWTRPRPQPRRGRG